MQERNLKLKGRVLIRNISSVYWSDPNKEVQAQMNSTWSLISVVSYSETLILETHRGELWPVQSHIMYDVTAKSTIPMPCLKFFLPCLCLFKDHEARMKRLTHEKN